LPTVFTIIAIKQKKKLQSEPKLFIVVYR